MKRKTGIRARGNAKSSEAVKVYPDGREVCQGNAAGKREYERRRVQRWILDRGMCCLCDRPLPFIMATTEHPGGRGMGGSKRDDRVESIRVAHYAGNSAKGSMTLERYRQLPTEVRVRNCQG